MHAMLSTPCSHLDLDARANRLPIPPSKMPESAPGRRSVHALAGCVELRVSFLRGHG